MAFFNEMLIERKIPEKWVKSFSVPIFKDEGDVQEFKSCPHGN